MRGQSAVIGTMLFFVAMILVGAIFLSLISKTVKLLDAGRMEIEFLTRKAQESLKVVWDWDMVSAMEGYPKLIINNTGPVPIHIVQVRLSIREKGPDRFWWPKIVQGPWIIAEDKDLPVGGSLVIKASQKLNRKQIEDWYKNNMTRILEARIVTRYGNVFRTIYVPRPPKSGLKPGYHTILFYWSALDWMDTENNVWWHGDLLGYYKMTAPDDAWTIANGGIEIPKWIASNPKTIEFDFMAYLPRIDGNGYIDKNNFLVLAIEAISTEQGFPAPTGVKMNFTLEIEDMDGNSVYRVSTNTYGIVINYPSTIYFKMDPNDPRFQIMDVGEEQINMLKNIEPGWYIFKLRITFQPESAETAWLGLKSVFLYISNEKLW